jgi:hypothetical protein
MSVPPLQSFIDALLRVQAQGATFFRQNFHFVEKKNSQNFQAVSRHRDSDLTQPGSAGRIIIIGSTGMMIIMMRMRP